MFFEVLICHEYFHREFYAVLFFSSPFFHIKVDFSEVSHMLTKASTNHNVYAELASCPSPITTSITADSDE